MAWAFAIPAVLSTVGTVAKAGGQYKGGQSTASTDAYKAVIARRNADAMGQAAVRTVQGGEVNSDVAGLRTEENVGKALATQGALNIDPNGRTAANVRASIAESGRLDQLTTLSDAQLKGWGYRVKQDEDLTQAQLDTAEGAGAEAGGTGAAVGTLLSGASQLPWGSMFGGGGTTPSGGTAP